MNLVYDPDAVAVVIQMALGHRLKKGGESGVKGCSVYLTDPQ
jgi:hypothetical protein